jgi:hypothetical protein
VLLAAEAERQTLVVYAPGARLTCIDHFLHWSTGAENDNTKPEPATTDAKATDHHHDRSGGLSKLGRILSP